MKARHYLDGRDDQPPLFPADQPDQLTLDQAEVEAARTEAARFYCREHAPEGVQPEPYDDGRPACVVCGRANYAVKPYRSP